MSTQPKVTDETETTETTAIDPKTQIDTGFIKLVKVYDSKLKTAGHKYGEVIDYVIANLMVDKTIKKDGVDVVTRKANVKVIIASLLTMEDPATGKMKTESSCRSIASYIAKMCDPANAELLAKLKAGEITVRESRAQGRKAQSAPAMSVEARMRVHLAKAAAIGCEKMDLEAFLEEAKQAFNEIAIQVETDAKNKAEAKAAIAATEQQVQAQTEAMATAVQA